YDPCPPFAFARQVCQPYHLGGALDLGGKQVLVAGQGVERGSVGNLSADQSMHDLASHRVRRDVHFERVVETSEVGGIDLRVVRDPDGRYMVVFECAIDPGLGVEAAGGVAPAQAHQFSDAALACAGEDVFHFVEQQSGLRTFVQSTLTE